MTNYIYKPVFESLDRLLTLSNDIEKLYKTKYHERSNYAKWSYTALDIMWKLGAILTCAGLAASGYSFSATCLILIPTSMIMYTTAKKIQNCVLGRKNPSPDLRMFLYTAALLFIQYRVINLTTTNLIPTSLSLFTTSFSGSILEYLNDHFDDIKSRNWKLDNKQIEELKPTFENDCKVLAVYFQTITLMICTYKNERTTADFFVTKLQDASIDNKELKNKVESITQQYKADYEKMRKTIQDQFNNTPKATNLISLLDCIKI